MLESTLPVPGSVPLTGIELLRRRALESPRREVYLFLGNGEAESGRLTLGEMDERARNIGGMLQSLVEPDSFCLQGVSLLLDDLDSFSN